MSAGFGHQLALSLERQGVQVFAGCLDVRGEGACALKICGSQRLHVVQCDVTNMSSIAQARTLVEENLSGRGKQKFVKTRTRFNT